MRRFLVCVCRSLRTTRSTHASGLWLAKGGYDSLPWRPLFGVPVFLSSPPPVSLMKERKEILKRNTHTLTELLSLPFKHPADLSLHLVMMVPSNLHNCNVQVILIHNQIEKHWLRGIPGALPSPQSFTTLWFFKKAYRWTLNNNICFKSTWCLLISNLEYRMEK